MKKEQEIVWYEIQRIYQTMKKEQEIVSEEAISIFNMWECSSRRVYQPRQQTTGMEKHQPTLQGGMSMIGIHMTH
jgi:hypothetical protein